MSRFVSLRFRLKNDFMAQIGLESRSVRPQIFVREVPTICFYCLYRYLLTVGTWHYCFVSSFYTTRSPLSHFLTRVSASTVHYAINVEHNGVFLV